MLSHSKIIIVGQGISGTFLSYYLLKEGKDVLVFDEIKNNASSNITSGVINPVTGRRIVRTWMIEEIMPFAIKAYQAFEQFLQINIVHQTNILDFHPTAQMQLAFDERVKEETYLLNVTNTESWRQFFNYDFGIGEINPCWQINIQHLLQTWRKHLLEKEILIEQKFTQEHINEYKDCTIIFCDGVANTIFPFFNLLPFAPNKGESLIAEINDLPRKNIYKQSCAIVPWKDNLWWVGSNYEWNYLNDLPSKEFSTNMEQKLKSFLKLPYKIVDHFAGLRPANLERRPFVGFHPINKNLGILNGMGTKGCSLAPYFAHQLAANILHQAPIHPNADVKRFAGILSKQ
jgi:glycine/D-amino acid oxidase-like deaminating enzyme